jgi:TRAP-type C4-dicarboxylate transport system substrate-binding protein
MKSFYRIMGCVAAVLLALSVPGVCFSSEKISWKVATLAPQNVGYAKEFTSILLPALSKATDGSLAIKVYWGGVMGDDSQYLMKMRVGQIQAAGLSAEGTLNMSKPLAVLSLPFLFNNYEEVDYVKKRMTSRIDGIISSDGYRLLLWLDQDFDQIYSTRYPVTKLADFPKHRFIIWPGTMEGKFLEQLGTHPVLSGVPEIPASIKSGVADAAFAPALFVVGAQLYTNFIYVNTMKCRYFPAMTVCSNQAWERLPAQYQRNIAEGREKWARDFCLLTRNDTEKGIKAMNQYGVKLVTSSPEDVRQIREKVFPLWDELAGKLYTRDLLNEIKGYLAQYRAKKKH